MPTIARELERALDDERELDEVLADLAARRGAAAELPWLADAERLRHWLLENLDGAPLPDADAPLRFRVVTRERHGRLEDCDLELESAGWSPPRPVLGSAVLPRLVRETRADARLLAVAFAALAARRAVEGVDERLILAGRDAIRVHVSLDETLAVDLGDYDGEAWSGGRVSLR